MPNSKLDIFQDRVIQLSQMLAHYEASTDCALPPPKVFDLDEGEARVWTLFESDDVSIVKAYLTPNTLFPRHRHDELEFLILFRGYALYVSEAQGDSPARRLEMTPGKCVSVPIGKPHKIITEEEGAWFSVTTVPRGIGLTTL